MRDALYILYSKLCDTQLFAVHDFTASLHRHADGRQGNPQPVGKIG